MLKYQKSLFTVEMRFTKLRISFFLLCFFSLMSHRWYLAINAHRVHFLSTVRRERLNLTIHTNRDHSRLYNWFLSLHFWRVGSGDANAGYFMLDINPVGRPLGLTFIAFGILDKCRQGLMLCSSKKKKREWMKWSHLWYIKRDFLVRRVLPGISNVIR